MDKLRAIQDFLTLQDMPISWPHFIADLTLAILFSWLLGKLYERFGRALGDRKAVADDLVFVTLATFLVITIVKRSLALSLGMVGALSIVRFRAAIKEPEEIVHLFLAIAIGVGFGGEQRMPTIIVFLAIALITILRGLRKSTPVSGSDLLVLTGAPTLTGQLETLVKPHVTDYRLLRMEQAADHVELTLRVSGCSAEKLEQLRVKLSTDAAGSRISFHGHDSLH